MQIFEANRSIRVVCDSTSSRSGFNHIATLFVNGQERESVKIHYINRTWESYTFESVLKKLADETTSLNDAGKKALNKMIANGGKAEMERVNSQMKTIGAVAQMGEFFGSSQKEKNDWKARMIKAGLGNKEKRLNNVIAHMKKGG
jgi:hypothetical protein